MGDQSYRNLHYIISRFIALESLQNNIAERLKGLKPLFSYFRHQDILAKSQLTWTDDKIHLVELTYGIYIIGSLNGGKAELSAIVFWLESILQVQIGSVYRKFIDISRSKNFSYSKYLDAAKEAIDKHVLDQLR